MNKMIPRYIISSERILQFTFACICIALSLSFQTNTANSQTVYQSEREIPFVATVDVVIVGGTTAAVAAAIEASSNGARVYLVAQRLYLGEDMCATLRLKKEPSRILKTKLEKQIFGDKNEVSPLNVKASLNKALLDANVEFVFGSFVTDLLWNDKKDKLSGVVIANRAGRQAISAKSIIDATSNAWICRMAGAETKPWNGGKINFERTILMPGADRNSPNYVVKKLAINMDDLHFPSFAKAEQVAREETYQDGQLRASESLFYVPPCPVICNKNADNWDDSKGIELEFFQPKGFENLFVLSGSAGFPRSVAKPLLEPAAMCEAGVLVGKASAKITVNTNQINKSTFKTTQPLSPKGDIHELLTGLRPLERKNSSVRQPNSGVSILDKYDVVVIGGGTSGAPAAIAAARMGMKVLVMEYQEGLGGVGTLGLIGKPWHGRNVGFAAEVPFPKDNLEPKMEWYRSEIKKAGGDIWLGVLGCGAFVEGNQVKGAVIVTPEGRGVVLADVVIDGTGNADIAIAAGSDYRFGEIEKGQIALQGTGLSSRPLIGNYINSDYLLVDETDMVDVWRTLVSVQETKNSENIYDVASLIQSRERRRIIGDFTLNYLDQVVGRTFPDVIVFSGSDYDSHGYPSSSYFALLPHDEVSRKQNHPAPGGTCYTPYRSLIPKNLDGILVTGLGISMERDASAMVRMQLDLANQGYAAGIAASLAITSDRQLRDIDIKEFQQILVSKGNLPDSIMGLKDSYPLAKEVIQQAIIDYGKAENPTQAGRPLAIILTHKKVSLPLVKEAYHASVGKQKLQYACVLGMCGEKEGTKTLLSELNNFAGWDKKIFQGSMADYAHLPTPIDGLILALGNTGDKSALPILLDLVDRLDADVTLSHHRALAIALEKIGAPSACKPLADLLQKPGMQGHAMLNMEDAMTDLSNDGKGPNGKLPLHKRTRALREIILARVLYRCGDYQGIGKKILESYKNDWRGLLARHAQAILNEK